MYEIKQTGLGVDVLTFTDIDGNVLYIPEDERNTDYQAYLAWKTEQETA